MRDNASMNGFREYSKAKATLLDRRLVRIGPQSQRPDTGQASLLCVYSSGDQVF
jgi:hypothetical protein